MAAGLGVLRLPPDAFWRMTPRELSAALHGIYGSRNEAPGRDELDALMRLFPDRE